jgi:hypothetical protein
MKQQWFFFAGIAMAIMVNTSAIAESGSVNKTQQSTNDSHSATEAPKNAGSTESKKTEHASHQKKLDDVEFPTVEFVIG